VKEPPTIEEARNVCRLVDLITETVNAFARDRERSDHPLQTGEVLSALFTLMFNIEGVNIETFAAMFDKNVRHAENHPRVHDA
jgi:hypothetical protein